MKVQFSAPAPVVVSPAGSRVIKAFNNELTVLLGAAETGGLFTLGMLLVPPGAGAPRHYHENEDECFVPLAGVVEFLVEDVWTEAPAGAAVFLPKRSIHAFRNSGTEPLRMLVQTSPAGFETFFERCAEEFAKAEGPDMSRIVAISADYGIRYPDEQ